MKKQSIALMLVLVACSCSDSESGKNASEQVGKSIFALTADDFDWHTTFSASSTTLTDIVVEKGDVLLLGGAGTITADGQTYGPNGSPAWGGTACAFVNRPVFALYGRIGKSVFPIGSDTALLAPEGGTLSFVVNTSSVATASGAFAVTVHRHLRSTVLMAEDPSVADIRVVDTKNVSVDSAADWTPSGVMVQRGQKVFVDATGTVLADGTNYDANGARMIAGTAGKLVNRYAYRLYGRVGDTIIELGASAAFMAPADGALELIINNVDGATGTVNVAIGRGIVPAHGLVGLETANPTKATINPDAAWHATTLTVERGRPIVVHATGTVTTADGAFDAYGAGAVGGTSYLLTNGPVQALHGRIGNEVFFLGGDNALLAPASGTLELAINSATGCSGCQASGALDVSVAAP